MAIIHAVYKNGAFWPTEPVDLPEGSAVEIELPRVAEVSQEKRLAAIYQWLGRRFESGESEVAARHDEHQP